jgi:tRNA (guanine-N7-)-methyltransferase
VRRAKRLSLDELAPYLLIPLEPPARFDWRAVFGNDNPVELEVGFGKGLFLLNASQACPEVNFLGIEILRKYQLYAATRFAKRSLKNVRLVKADAREFLRDYVPDQSLQAIHVYFPDPWWKKRHMKRRVFTADFAAQCERTLSSGGRLNLVTDVADYFTVMCELLEHHTGLKKLPAGAEPSGLRLDEKEPGHDLDYLTNFERKFRKEGRTIHRCLYVKA